jgi:hypothetical protein
MRDSLEISWNLFNQSSDRIVWKLFTLAIAFLLIWLLSSIIMLINNKLEFLLVSKK